MLHELAHRLHFKFLKAKDRDIRSIYFRLGMQEKDRLRSLATDPTLRPKPGETISSKGKTYVVTQVIYDKVHLVREGSPEVKASIPLVGWIENKGVDVFHGQTFVSSYAKRNHEENFAEMLAFWCLDKLPEEQVRLLESVI